MRPQMTDHNGQQSRPNQRGGHGLSRRTFLSGAVAAATLTATGAAAGSADAKRKPRTTSTATAPIALVYRGPASQYWCPESVANLLKSGPVPFTVKYCGPNEATPLNSTSLSTAALYAQPGGGSLASAWPHLSAAAPAIRTFVRNGGAYLGFCLGAYLAGPTALGLFDGTVTRYARTSGSEITTYGGTIVDVDWRGRSEILYFQDGCQFTPTSPADVTVLGTYSTGTAAAVVSRFGRGSVGLVGPHPEADRSWYAPPLVNPNGIDYTCGHDLIRATWNARG